MASPRHSPRSRLRVQSRVNDSQCVEFVTGQKDSVCITGQIGLNPPPPVLAGDKKVTLNLNVDFCVANTHIFTGLPQRKGVNPNCCQMYTEIKYVKDVSCVGHLSSANLVTNAQPVVMDPPVGARLHNFWEKWEALGSSPKVVTTLREGYTLPFRFRPNLTRNCNKQLSQSIQTGPPFRGTVSAGEQKCSRTGRKSEFPGFLQPAIFGTETRQPMETYHGSEQLEHLFKHRVVQNGHPRDNKDLPIVRGMGHFHRLQRRILPHTYSQSVQEVHAFSPTGSVLPVQSPTLWPLHSSNRVHSGGQRGQTDGTAEGYKNPPVPRRLVDESHIPSKLSPAYTDVDSSLSGTRLAGEQGFQLRRLPVRPERGQGQTHTRALAGLDRQDSVTTVRSGVPGPAVHVPHRSSHSNRKASPPRATPHEAHTVALEKQLEGSRVTRKGDSSPQVTPPPPKVVAGGRPCATRSTITPSKTCSANIYRRIQGRVGSSLKRAHCKGNLVPSRKQVAHKSFRAKSSLSSSKTVSKPLLQQVATDNTTVVAYINKEGGMKSGSLCALLWRILSWCTRKQVTLRARHIPGRLNVIADKLSRLGQTIQTEWFLHPEVFQAICSRWYQPQVDQFATRFNNKLPQLVSPVPDPQAWAVDALSLSWEDLDPYAFPPAAILGKVVEKLQDYPCNRMILIAPGWPNMPWFWDLHLTGVTQVLDKHAPIISRKAKQQSDEWLSDSYRMARSLRQQFERRWRKHKSELNRSRLRRQIAWCNRLANKDKGSYYTNLITANSRDPKKLWQSLRKVLHRTSETVLPAHSSDKSLADMFASFFSNKISKIRDTFATSGSFNDAPDSVPPAFNAFIPVTEDEVYKCISESPTKSCSLDPIPTFLLVLISSSLPLPSW